MTASPRLRAAVVGTGGIAARHRTAYAELRGDVELVAAVDVDGERVREFCSTTGSARPYDDLTDMLAAERPDLVSVCTPPSLHRDAVLTCLEAGAWVWCEKPPVLSLSEYDTIAAAERSGGPHVSFVFQHRFGAAAEHARNLLRSGELGEPAVAHCQTTWYRDAAYFQVPWRGKWETEGGGPTVGHGIHQMDLLLHLLGPWEEISAMTARLVHDVETEDVSTALVRFSSGTVATVVNSVLSPDQVSRIRLDCTEATVELTHLYGYGNDDWTYVPAPHVDDEQRVARWRTPAEDHRSSHTAMLRRLITALRTGRRPMCSGEDGRAALELITALYKAASTGTTVRSGEIDASDSFYTALHGGSPELLIGKE
ncbi:Gfo/Idh/MocA family protein [Salinifilum ghardaiensis]